METGDKVWDTTWQRWVRVNEVVRTEDTEKVIAVWVEIEGVKGRYKTHPDNLKTQAEVLK